MRCDDIIIKVSCPEARGDVKNFLYQAAPAHGFILQTFVWHRYKTVKTITKTLIASNYCFFPIKKKLHSESPTMET